MNNKRIILAIGFGVVLVAGTLSHATTLRHFSKMSEREQAELLNDRVRIIHHWLARNEPETANCVQKAFNEILPGKRYSGASQELSEFLESVPKKERGERRLGGTILIWIREHLCAD